MIDYYLHKKCSLVMPTAKQKENVRCKGCVWLDKETHRCIFSLNYPKSVDIKEIERRIKSVNLDQQNKLSEVWRRFVLENDLIK